MFSRFLLFFGAAGAGLCAAEAGRRRALRGGGLCAAATGRRGFGARFLAKPCSSVSFAPSPGPFSATGRRRLGARIPAKPCSFVSFAPSSGAFLASGRRGFGARFSAKPCSFVSFAPSPGAFSATGRRGFGARFPAKPCSFVNGHHVFGTKGARPARTWCTIPRKPLLFRRRAPRLWGQRRRRRTGRGASLPAKPCSFVNGHHVFGTKGARPARTWCTIPRKTLFFRQQAPRLWGQRRRRHQIPSL